MDGWYPSNDIWTYVSGNSFTISGVDRTAVYSPGTRVKCTNNGVTFYGVVISSSFSTDTTVTLAANNDYALANSAITNPFYSNMINAQGYPDWFNYTPTLGIIGGTFTSTVINEARFSITGRTCFLQISFTGTVGGSPGQNITFTLPVVPNNASAGSVPTGALWVQDSTLVAGVAYYNGSSTMFARKYDASNFTTGSNRYVVSNMAYEF